MATSIRLAMKMREFCQLLVDLERDSDGESRRRLLSGYWTNRAFSTDAAWGLALLCGWSVPRVISPRALADMACRHAGLDEFLSQACYAATGDLVEMASLLPTPSASGDDSTLSDWMTHRLEELRAAPETIQETLILHDWTRLSQMERAFWNRVITGTFRAGVDRELIWEVLATIHGVPSATIAARYHRDFQPTETGLKRLVTGYSYGNAETISPWPFRTSQSITDECLPSICLEEYVCEMKHEGLRGQLLRTSAGGEVWLRSLAPATRIPNEIQEIVDQLPVGTVLDGLIVCQEDDQYLSASQTETILTTKSESRFKSASGTWRFIAFDLLTLKSEPLVDESLAARRDRLMTLVAQIAKPYLVFSPEVSARNIDQLTEFHATCRAEGCLGILLKRRNSRYVDMRNGAMSDWLCWPAERNHVETILMSVCRDGSGGWKEWTFGIWNNGALVPIARMAVDNSTAFCKGTDDKVLESRIKEAQQEKFGPVITLAPRLVFRLSYVTIDRSPRHKAGVVLRDPQIVEWLAETDPSGAGTLNELLREPRDSFLGRFRAAPRSPTR